MQPHNQGYLFVFEGPDGVGKTTLAQAAVEIMSNNSIPCQYLAFPGRLEGTLGHHIYDLHHGRAKLDTSKVAPTALQALHVAAHIDAIENQIAPLLKEGTSVVLDRYWWSTLAYGNVNGANVQTLTALVHAEILHWNELKPDHIFLIKRDQPIEREFNDKWCQLVTSYDQLLTQETKKQKCTVIENTNSITETLSEIVNILSDVMTVSIQYRKNTEKKSLKNDPSVVHASKLLTVFSPFAPAKTSKLYDVYWYFAAERQKIFFSRIDRKPAPWTDDPILANYKFTNAYRASDRVSQYLIRHVIYEGDQSPEELFFRIMLFKVFNKISTWELFVNAFHEVRFSEYRRDRYDHVIMNAMLQGIRVFAAAYIMPSGTSTFGQSKKHRNYLTLIELMMREEVPRKVTEARKMQQVFDLLSSYPMMGNFLAYQLTTDLNYSTLTDFPETQFVIPGPGAKSGIRKCFQTTGGLSEADIIRRVQEMQGNEFECREIAFKSLWGRPLQLIDCQNLFCEVDKYARVAYPEISGIGNRTQIKQKFEASNSEAISYWYPPKWGINITRESETTNNAL